MKINKPKTPIRFPKIKRVQAKTISQELLSIKPMESPIPFGEFLKKLGLVK